VDVGEGTEEVLLCLLRSWGKQRLHQCRHCHIFTASDGLPVQEQWVDLGLWRALE
jgi:hypothetical protein